MKTKNKTNLKMSQFENLKMNTSSLCKGAIIALFLIVQHSTFPRTRQHLQVGRQLQRLGCCKIRLD